MNDTVEIRTPAVICHRHREELPPGALDFSASGNLYATHALHAFAARCPPPLARWAIDTFTDPGDVVLDVMCGSGTTLVEAALAGRYGQGVDIDPLARMVALAKATPADAGAIDDLADEVERLAPRTADDGWRPDLPRLDYWFRAEVSADLSRLRQLIRRLAVDGPLRRLAWTVFSSLIVGRTSVANARDLVHSRHHYREWTEDPLTVSRFLRGLRRASRLMAQFAEALPAVAYPACLVGSDARALTLSGGAVDLVFFSPPYVSALDYPRAHAFAVAWLSDVFDISPENYRSHARRYVGSDRAPLAAATPTQPLPVASGHESVDAVVAALAETPERAWVVSRYFSDMAAVFAQAARVTRPGGHVVVVVCPSNIRRVPVPTHEIFHTLAPAVSGGRLHLGAHYSRTIHDARRVMPYLEAKFGERMREEYVLVFCRRPDQATPSSRSSAAAPGSDRRRRATAAPSTRS
ncbi:MAG: DNA methyltransferase [Micromonosporaceae bacterium]